VLLARKGARKVRNFPSVTFAILFCYTIFKQFINVLATQNKNYNQNWPFLTKDMNFFKVFTLLPFQAKRLAEGNFLQLFCLPVPAP